MKKLLILWLFVSGSLFGQTTYRNTFREDGNDYTYVPQEAKATVNWKRFPRFSINKDWVYWGPRFKKRTGEIGEWDDDFATHGFRQLVPNLNYSGTGNDAVNYQDILNNTGDKYMGYVLMPGTTGQMPDYLKNPYNALSNSDPRKAEIGKYINSLIPVTDAASARLMGNWMGDLIKNQICGGKIPKWVTIDEESAHYWDAGGEGSLRLFVGNLYLGILDVCTTSKIFSYGPKPIHTPKYTGYADMGRSIGGYLFTEHPTFGPNFWWTTGNTSAPLDVNNPLAQALRANGGGVAAGDHYWRTTIGGMTTIYQKDGSGNFIMSGGRRVLRTDNSQTTIFGKTFTVYGADPNYFGQNEYDYHTSWLYEDLSGEEANRFWMNGRNYALRKNDRSSDFTGVLLGDWYRTNTEEANAPGQGDPRPIDPAAQEMGTIFRALLHDAEFLWHGEYLQRGPTTHDSQAVQFPGVTTNLNGYKTNLGQFEYIVKGLHRFSEFEGRPWGNWYWVRPHRGIDVDADKWKEAAIRGRISETGNHVQIAAAWPMLDPSDVVRVDVWVDTGTWKSGSTHFNITGRKTYLDCWQVPDVPPGTTILPQHLRFRYTSPLVSPTVTVTWTGDYRFTASNSETIPTAIDN
ncbi:hypothetical protein [Spirosoma endbachense]|uniref:Uncharacterized protein n=1 Tax=Spirosoma endbachense TaxID=2666025 RepID=A0A6P1VW35_9BACT|nr:hypothetical protein [Spirosoma endbachense]QHV96302.1 hypothetical protein GJR95_15315 [Spirosoma endbachense]